jgi:hypothetical protein
MAFSTETRTQALVLAARHCCVCHRYKGQKIEVHHIVPASEGGDDTSDNAIALCFDCHADAGHYNPRHPRGTKFSPQELKQARDIWHIAVKVNQIDAPTEKDLLYCRYLVCKSFSALREIVDGKLTEIPVTSPLLAKTSAGEFLAQIVRSHPVSYRHSHIPGKAFPDRNAYGRAHPDARVFERPSMNLFPYFEASRVPSRDELSTQIASQDFVTFTLLNEGVPVEEISEAFAYDEVCGERSFQEIYRLRPLWGVFLAATNIANSPLRLNSLTCEAESTESIGYRPITARTLPSVEEISLPRMPLAVGETVVIPVATILGPIQEKPFETMRSEYRDIQTGEVQSTEHCDVSGLLGELALVGPSLWPSRFQFNKSVNPNHQDVHQLDLSNLYLIDRFWEAGCCPHLFLERITDLSLAYWGEVWASAPHLVQVSCLVVPEGIGALLLAELESESAHIEEISVNGRSVIDRCLLQNGQHIRIPVTPGDSIRLVGCYIPYPSIRDREPDPWRKNTVISRFMSAATFQAYATEHS